MLTVRSADNNRCLFKNNTVPPDTSPKHSDGVVMRLECHYSIQTAAALCPRRANVVVCRGHVVVSNER